MQVNIEEIDKMRARVDDESLVTGFLRVLARFCAENKPLNRDDLAAIGREVGLDEERLIEAGLVANDGGCFWPVEAERYFVRSRRH